MDTYRMPSHLMQRLHALRMRHGLPKGNAVAVPAAVAVPTTAAVAVPTAAVAVPTVFTAAAVHAAAVWQLRRRLRRRDHRW